jgi:hypothetical protein
MLGSSSDSINTQIFKKSKTTKSNLAGIPEFKLLVALSVPRGAFLACVQPPGASRRPPKARKCQNPEKKQNTCNTGMGNRVSNKSIFLEFLEKVVSKALST